MIEIAIADSTTGFFHFSLAADSVSLSFLTMWKTLPQPMRSRWTPRNPNRHNRQEGPAITTRDKIARSLRRRRKTSPSNPLNLTSSFAAMAPSFLQPPTPGKTARSVTSPLKVSAAQSPPISSISTPPNNSTNSAASPSASPRKVNSELGIVSSEKRPTQLACSAAFIFSQARA